MPGWLGKNKTDKKLFSFEKKSEWSLERTNDATSIEEIKEHIVALPPQTISMDELRLKFE